MPAWNQLSNLVGNRSLFQQTVLAAALLAEEGRLIVVAGQDHSGHIEAQFAELGIEGYVILEESGAILLR